MARKKKGKISIEGSPLQDITIGQIKQNKYGWIGILFLFAMFLALVYYLPEVSVYLQEYFKTPSAGSSNMPLPNTNENVNTNITPDPDENNNEVVHIYNIGDVNEVSINGLNISNITYFNDTMSYDISFNGSEVLNLSEQNIYLETYLEDGNLVSRHYLNGIINLNETLSFSHDNITDAKTFTFKEILEEDYTYIDIAIDEETKESILTCIKDSDTLSYIFIDGLLKKIDNTFSFNKTDENVNELYYDYNNLVESYQNQNGITVSLNSGITKYDYKMIIDYNTYSGKIDYKYYYPKDTMPREVNFKMEAMGYSCR